MSAKVDPEIAEPVDGDVEDEEVEEEEDAGDNKTLAKRLLKDPQVLAALQGKVSSMMNQSSPADYISTLPAVVKKRIKALKKIQLEAMHIEAKFYEEVHALECKYHKQYIPLFEKRKTIVQGSYEPTEAECDFPDDEDEQELADQVNKVKIEDEKKGGEGDQVMDESTKGIPGFWLTIFKNVEMLYDMVQEHDEPILKHLDDIKIIFHQNNPMGFTLEFYFTENEHFTNTVLTKAYEMKCTPDEDDPFSFEGPEIYKCKGCTIDWKKGKNVTVKLIKKKQKHKAHGQVRTVTKTVQNDSFFNFFNPPTVPEDPEAELDDDTQALLTADFEIGHYLRENIIPRAVLYFTGEALEEDEFEEEEEGDEDDEDEEDDEDYQPKSGKVAKQVPKQNPEECKQQ